MGQAEIQTRRDTPEEYFALEAQSEMRHEYLEGKAFALAGGSKTHSLLVQNASARLRTPLRSKGCQVFVGDVRLCGKRRILLHVPRRSC